MPREIPVSLRLCWTDPVTGEARSVPLEGALRFGSNRQQNDVVLPLRSVEPFHAEILGDQAGGWELVALGPRRLKVGDQMTPRARLTVGTEFSVGPVAFRVRPSELTVSRAVSSTGSRRAFAPPPPAPAPGRWAVAGAALLVSATGVATWSALHQKAEVASGFRAKAASPAAAAAGRARPKAKAAGRTALLEAGSVATSPAAAPDSGAAAPIVLVKIGGSWAPVQGFFVTTNGLVLTNQRLIAAAESILVRAAEADAPVTARLVASDPGKDLALLEVPVNGLVLATRLDDDDALRAAALALGVPAADVRAFVGAHR
ncbi:MAG: trypsin-like peptidase domain-containing protein [Acidobacteriota bacterium]